MKVWIDQDLCTGDGLCEEIAPASSRCSTTVSPTSRRAIRFEVRPGRCRRHGPGAQDLEDAVTEAAEECPGECIFIES